MLASHRPYIDRLDTSHSAVVFELDTREIPQCISHREGVETLQFNAFERLRNDDIFGQGTRCHLHFLHLELAV